MTETAVYNTTVTWVGGHEGRVHMGNGPEMSFSAPADAHGMPDVLTPEDAFVAAVNTCIMLMFVWACERFRLDLRTYECRAEGTKVIELDRTEIFSSVRLEPRITIGAGGEDPAGVRRRAERAMAAAEKYSLVAHSVKAKVTVEPEFAVEP